MKQKIKIKRRLLGALIGLLLAFSMTGIRDLIYEQIPADYYYSFEQPVVIEEEVIACDTTDEVVVHGNTYRFSRKDLLIDITRNLVKTSNDGIQRTPEIDVVRKYAIKEGEGNVRVPFIINCSNIKHEGNYYFEAISSFDVNGAHKEYFWTTETFFISLSDK